MNSEEWKKAKKLGEFFGKMADMGLGVHPDAGHDDKSAQQRTKAYPAFEETPQPKTEGWQPL